MSRSAIVRLPLGPPRTDSTATKFDFALNWGGVIELQELTDEGLAVTHARLANGTWRHQDVAETLRLGLVGGGRSREAAALLTDTYVRPPYLAEAVLIARSICAAALVGSEDEPLGEAEGEEAKRFLPCLRAGIAGLASLLLRRRGASASPN
jgi:hypothetical protein